MNKIKILSLFSGIGAFEKALTNIEIEHEIVNYCEIDKFASFAYSILHNVSENKNLIDVTKINIDKLENFDLLTHGSPCQSFSLAGKGEGGDEGSGTKSSLMWYTVDIISKNLPKFVIWENVKAVTFKQHVHNLNKYIDKLNELGYNSYSQVLNAKDYNSVQSRERLFVMSIRKDIDKSTFKFPEPLKNIKTINNITEKSNVDEKYYCKDNSYLQKFISNVNKKIADFKKPSKFGLIRIGEINNPNMLDMNKRVFSIDGCSPTLVTGSDSIPKIGEFKVRKLTPLECWRATGFSDEDYWNVREALEDKFYNGKDRSDSQMYHMAGNSIVVNVLEAILGEVFN